VADRAQQDFFDPSVRASIVPKESIYLLSEHGERIGCDQDYAER
jgi:hypothetical protein